MRCGTTAELFIYVYDLSTGEVNSATLTYHHILLLVKLQFLSRNVLQAINSCYRLVHGSRHGIAIPRYIFHLVAQRPLSG
jgi:hypothetical protein